MTVKVIKVLTTALAVAMVWSGAGSAKEVASPDPFGPYWSIAQNRDCLVWNHGAGDAIEPFTWSGPCVDGKAEGYGLLTYRGGKFTFEGNMRAGRRHGRGIIISADGYRYEGEFVDGQPRGYGTTSLVSGGRYDGPHRVDDLETAGTTDSHDTRTTEIESFQFACEMPGGRVLKPKFGDIAGASYADLPAQRQQCLETIDHKIALCRENIDLGLEAENRELAVCRPTFERQARACVSHFELERSKCGIDGSHLAATKRDSEDIDEQVRPRAQEVEHSRSLAVEPLDRIMEVSEDANLRAGPAVHYGVLATLEEGASVHVTGAVQGRNWYRVQPLETNGAAFVHGSLVREAAYAPLEPLFKDGAVNALEPQPHEISVTPLQSPPEGDADAPLHTFGPDWSMTDKQDCQVWNYGEAELEPFIWSGGCVDGKASGDGRLTFLDGDYVYEGAMTAGMMDGHGTIISSDGYHYEGAWVNGEPHGHGIEVLASGEQYEGEYRHGKRHGHGLYKTVSGDVFEGEWRDGRPHGYGTYTNADGNVFQGEWHDGCIGERDGEWATIGTPPEVCGYL